MNPPSANNVDKKKESANLEMKSKWESDHDAPKTKIDDSSDALYKPIKNIQWNNGTSIFYLILGKMFKFFSI